MVDEPWKTYSMLYTPTQISFDLLQRDDRFQLSRPFDRFPQRKVFYLTISRDLALFEKLDKLALLLFKQIS